MPDLAADCSPALYALADDPALGLAGVKMGEWLEGTAAEAIVRFPGKTILYHHGSPIPGGEPGAPGPAAALARWLARTRSPWLSAHLDVYADSAYRACLRGGRPLPRLDEAQALAGLSRAVSAIRAVVQVPLLLENVDPLVPLDDCPAPLPGFITRALAATGCGLLLDLAHARVSATAIGCDVHDYLLALPLARAVELHVSGPRWVGGRLKDAHEPLVEEDYALLAWVLARCRPKAVTLEYGAQPAELRHQLLRLRQLLAEAEEGGAA